MESPVNVDFYKSILDKAQQNLDQGTMMKNKYLEDVYNQKYYDKDAYNAATSKAEGILRDSLNSPFVNPSKIGNDIVRAGRVYAPFKAANDRQLELVKQADEYKQHYGDSAWMSDPTKLKLQDENGDFKDPSKLNLSLVNASNIDDLINSHEKGFLTSETPEHKVHSNIPYQINLQTEKGLSDAQKQTYYGKNGSKIGELTDVVLKTHPELLDMFNGDKNKLLEKLIPRIQSVVGQYGQSINNKYVEDVFGLHLAEQREKATKPSPDPDNPTAPTRGDIIPSNINIGKVLSDIGGGKQYDWDNSKVNLNSKGNIMAVKPAVNTNIGMYKAQIPGVPTEDYGGRYRQLDAIAKTLRKQGYTINSHQDVINIASKIAENSVAAYGLKNEKVLDNFGINGSNPFSPGTDVNKASGLEYVDDDGKRVEVNSLADLRKKLKLDNTKTLTDLKIPTLEKQLGDTPDRIIDQGGNSSKIAKSVINGKGVPTTVYYNSGNDYVTKYQEPVRQAKHALMTSEESNVYLPNTGLTIIAKKVPHVVSGPDGKPMVIYKIGKFDYLKDNKSYDNDNNQIANRLNAALESDVGETELMKTAINSRDWNLKQHHVYLKTETDKKINTINQPTEQPE